MREVLIFAVGAVVGGTFAYWDANHYLTWHGRFDWFFALRCRWLGIHEPYPPNWTDCVHCHYAGPLVQEQERRRQRILAEMHAALTRIVRPTTPTAGDGARREP